MKDPHTGDPRGFAFVTMEADVDANAAIDGLNGTEIRERAIVVAKVCFVSPIKREQKGLNGILPAHFRPAADALGPLPPGCTKVLPRGKGAVAGRSSLVEVVDTTTGGAMMTVATTTAIAMTDECVRACGPNGPLTLTQLWLQGGDDRRSYRDDRYNGGGGSYAAPMRDDRRDRYEGGRRDDRSVGAKLYNLHRGTRG
jgi:RNA recognition motif. (a.k.a. RRM, RBD, or RNP domain)